MSKLLKLIFLSFSISLISQAVEPIKVLLITGGGFHDYKKQAELLTKGIKKYANVKFDIVNETESKTKTVFSPFKKENWTKAYDVIIHNECSADLGDELGNKVAEEHFKSEAGVVMIHCAFHTFRKMKGDKWRKALGATSYKHTHQKPVKVVFDQKDHPILKQCKEFTTGKEELYIIDKIFENCKPIATGIQGKHKHPVMFANKFGKAKIFSITLGHNNETFEIDEWIKVVSHGLLWSCGKLNDDGTPKEGYGPSK